MPIIIKSPHRMLRVISSLALLAVGCTGREPSSDEGTGSSDTGAPLGLAPFESTMLVHIYYQTPQRLERLVSELDVLEHADHDEGYVAALIEPDDYERLVSEAPSPRPRRSSRT